MKQETTKEKKQPKSGISLDLNNKKFDGNKLNQQAVKLMNRAMTLDFIKSLLLGAGVILMCIYTSDFSKLIPATIAVGSLPSIGRWLKSQVGNKSP